MDSPLVTILMPVYNAELFLRRAIDSILAQTYTNLEFLIINDGSTDSSLAIIRSYSDRRIVLIENDKNKGLIFSLNIGFEKAKGKYIARMDADDISSPKRIEKQCAYMEKNVDVGILGTFIQKETKFKIYSDSHLTSNDLKARLLFNNIFNHPTIMFRSSFLKENKIYYDQEYKHGEDYNLWLKAIKETNIAILKEPLLFYENHQDQISVVFTSEQKASVIKSHQQFFTSLYLDFNKEDLEIHRRLFYQDYLFTNDFLISVENWLIKISKNVALQNIVTKDALKKAVSVIWFEVCTHFASNKIKTKKNYYDSELFIKKNISITYRSLFLLKRSFFK